MASTYSPNLRLELITTGEQSGTWGATTNTNLGTLLEQAIGGYESVGIVTGDNTLTTQNGSTDQSRNAVLRLSGSLSGTTTVNCGLIEKVYIVQNDATGAVTFRANSSDTGISLASGARKLLYCNGTNVLEAVNDLPSGATAGGVALVSISGTQTLTNKTLTSPVITNGGTLTLPTSTDTLVGRATTDTLTNKTLTAPKFADGGFIADANGNEIVVLDTVTSAVNEITVANAAAGAGPSISATGSDSNINLNLVPKGTGAVNVSGTLNGLRYLDVSNSDTNANSGSIVRLISSDVAGTGNAAANIVKYKNGAFTIANAETNAAAYINLNVGSSERMRIDSSGNVGIGTSSPANKLDVAGSGQFTQGTYGFVGVTSDTVQGQFAASGSGSSVNVRAVSNHPLVFFTNNTSRFTIGALGQFGIGTGASYGTSGQVLTSGGASAAPSWADKVTRATSIATTSGTAHDFPSIPSGVKRITLMISGVSTNGTGNVILQLGSSGTPLASGYLGNYAEWQNGGNAGLSTYSTSFQITGTSAAGTTRHGAVTLTNLSGNIWTMTFTVSRGDSTFIYMGSGSVTLSGTLDIIRLSSTSTFDAGNINILYE